MVRVTHSLFKGLKSLVEFHEDLRKLYNLVMLSFDVAIKGALKRFVKFNDLVK